MIWIPVSQKSSSFGDTVLIRYTGGRPFGDRSWVECFAQLVGTVLSLWDAAALDAAGQDGEVAPTFINLADASIKMVGPPVNVQRIQLMCTADRNIAHTLAGHSTISQRAEYIHSWQKSLSSPF